MSMNDAKRTVSQEQFIQTAGFFPAYATNNLSYWHHPSENESS